jgi:hypothetical protein
MRIAKLEIRGCVVERLSVKQNDVEIAAFVIGMTLRAFLLFRIGLAAMKAHTRPAIGRNILVTCQA